MGRYRAHNPGTDNACGSSNLPPATDKDYIWCPKFFRILIGILYSLFKFNAAQLFFLRICLKLIHNSTIRRNNFVQTQIITMTSNVNDCEYGDHFGSLQFSPLIKRKSIFCCYLLGLWLTQCSPMNVGEHFYTVLCVSWPDLFWLV